MLILDRIFGKLEIIEPVVVDLVQSPVLQRLKKINQAGYPEPFFGINSSNRFEHSVGVYGWLKRYGAPLAEQISGLIHDVSHTAFSHCSDYVLAAKGQEEFQKYQDDIFEHFVLKSEIPEILKRHDCDIGYILDDKNFPLKETELPDLCADRIDYSVRDMLIHKKITVSVVNELLDNLTVQDKKWVFKNLAGAKQFAEIFSTANTELYCGIKSAVMFQTVSDYLRYALDKKYIVKADLFGTDMEVIEKINHHLAYDTELNKYWARMNNKYGYEINLENYDARVVCKSRVVDPLFLKDGIITRYSGINLEWKEFYRREMQPKEYFIKFN